MAGEDLINAAQGAIEAFNDSDWERYGAALTADSVYDEVGTSRRLQGMDEIRPCLEEWKAAMPDVRGTVDNAYAAGNTVVLEVTWNGTHSGTAMEGPSGTIEPSGKTQTTRASWVMTFDGDKISESRHYFDMLSFMQQIGALPQ